MTWTTRVSIIVVLFSFILYISNISKVDLPKRKSFLKVETVEVFKPELAEKEIDCLAKNMYYEARGESLTGIALIGVVTLNRVKQGKDVCAVVYAPKQFSWTHQKVKAITGLQLEKFKRIVFLFINKSLYIPSKFTKATHYHATTIKDPYWTKKLIFLGTFGHHKFYTEPENIVASN